MCRPVIYFLIKLYDPSGCSLQLVGVLVTYFLVILQFASTTNVGTASLGSDISNTTLFLFKSP